MSELWGALAVLPPLVAAMILLGAALFDRPASEADAWRAGIGALALAGLAQARLLLGSFSGEQSLKLGTWWETGGIAVGLDLAWTPATAAWALTATGLSLGVLAFARAYLHREPGFQRGIAGMLALAGGVSLLALAADGLFAFLGWEVAGTASALLISFYPERPAAIRASLRAFATNRVADIALLMGLLGLAAAHGHTRFDAPDAPLWVIGVIGLAGLAKAAQLPFSPWLERAIEGPTPTTALFYGGLMVHAGVLVLARTAPLQPTVFAIALAVIASFTLIYALLSAAAQTDVKRVIVLHTIGAASGALLILAAGFPSLALLFSLLAMAAQTGRLLLGPSWIPLRAAAPAAGVPGWLVARPALRALAERRFDLEARLDGVVLPSVQIAAHAAERLDQRLLASFAGRIVPPSRPGAAPVIEDEEASDPHAGEGLFARATAVAAEAVQHAEERVVAGWVGEALPAGGTRFGARLERFEALLQRPAVPASVLLFTLFLIAGGLL